MKKKIGIYSFSCDEGCTITFFEILNRKFFEWKDKLEIVDSKAIGKDYEGNVDIAIVEGAISTKEEEEKIKEIRRRSNIVIAIGNCSILGSPSNIRNFFGEKEKEEIK
ncbi:MAG: NADP oxidoreductase, partial [Candidatus Micrarchaeia archaeon]